MTREELLKELNEQSKGILLNKVKCYLKTDFSVKSKKEYSYVSMCVDVVDSNGSINETEIQRVFVDDKSIQLLKILGVSNG